MEFLKFLLTFIVITFMITCCNAVSQYGKYQITKLKMEERLKINQQSSDFSNKRLSILLEIMKAQNELNKKLPKKD